MRKRTPFFCFRHIEPQLQTPLPTPLQSRFAELLRRYTKMKRRKNFVERRKKKFFRRFISAVCNLMKTNRLQNRKYYL